jgi:transposase-like protein
MDPPKARLAWVELYAKISDAGLVCRHCGISRPTLRKWWRRYQTDGEAGLVDHSRRPHRLAAQKVFADQGALILSLRRDRRVGVKQLRNELIRQHDMMLSLDTIHRTFVRHSEQVLKRPRRWRKGTRRYSRPVPGERVQMDVCKIRPGVYQYTAINDCSRYKVLGLYSRASGANTLDFLERVSRKCRSRFSTSNLIAGASSSPKAIQQRLMDWAIKFRPILPRSPHLNGKVEPTHSADREEFWGDVTVT